MSESHPNAVKVRAAIDQAVRGSLDVRDAFAPDLVWRIVGNHPPAGDYRGLEAWQALMRRRSEITGGTYRPQPQAWLGSDRHVFCFLRLTARRDDGREIDTAHVAVSGWARMASPMSSGTSAASRRPRTPSGLEPPGPEGIG